MMLDRSAGKLVVTSRCYALRKAFESALLSALLFAGLLSVPVKAFSQVPRGVFSLSGSGVAAGSDVLANPNVLGISLRQNWVDLEPSEGNFNWTFLDSEVARAAAAGKVVMLRIGTQSGKPAWVTTAIQNAGGKFFTFYNKDV